MSCRKVAGQRSALSSSAAAPDATAERVSTLMRVKRMPAWMQWGLSDTSSPTSNYDSVLGKLDAWDVITATADVHCGAAVFSNGYRAMTMAEFRWLKCWHNGKLPQAPSTAGRCPGFTLQLTVQAHEASRQVGHSGGLLRPRSAAAGP